MTLKALLIQLAGPRLMGSLDIWRHPGAMTGWGAPFNGQHFRLRIFSELLHVCDFRIIVETGTFRGVTTALFAATLLPVYTVEAHQLFYTSARMRLGIVSRHVHPHLGDSRKFLRQLSRQETLTAQRSFFYLDAHWEQDLPLHEELEIILAAWPDPIIMIDDFAVPDTNYRHDDYGPGKVLNQDYIADIVALHDLQVFYPAVPAEADTGERRGCVVLCRQGAAPLITSGVATLRPALRI